MSKLTSNDNQDNDHATLLRLQKKYTTALYSYFRVDNLDSERQKFLQGKTDYPSFEHVAILNSDQVSTKLTELKADLSSLGSSTPNSKQFLEWRIKEYTILDDFLILQVQGTVDEHYLQAYLDAQYDLYGDLEESLFQNILAYLGHKAGDSDHGQLFDQLKSQIKVAPGSKSLPAPDEKTFNEYRNKFMEASPDLWAVLQSIHDGVEYESDDIKSFMEQALRAIGADKFGWKVTRVRSGSNLVVSKHKRKILLPRNYTVSKARQLRQIIAHEVGGHVKRSITSDKPSEYVGYDDSEEGYAILLEQLVDDHFVHKRAMRYFAICLSVGVDGKRRDFRDVYNLLNIAYRIIGYGEQKAQKSAFNETTRAFRGGMPEIPGAIYIKDKIYLEGNLKVWRHLQSNDITSTELKQLFTQHDTMHEEA